MRKRVNQIHDLHGFRTRYLEIEPWNNNVMMEHNGSVMTRPGLVTFLTPSQSPIIIDMGQAVRCTPFTYTFEKHAIFGKQPLTWAMSPVPSCLTFNASTGTLSGTPCMAGTVNPQITVTNADGLTFRFRTKLVIEDYVPVILLPGES